MNWTLTEHACSMRLQADMSQGFWVEKVSHMSYLVNMSPSTAVDLQISEEIRREDSVNYSIFRIFSCPAYSLVDSKKKE